MFAKAFFVIMWNFQPQPLTSKRFLDYNKTEDYTPALIYVEFLQYNRNSCEPVYVHRNYLTNVILRVNTSLPTRNLYRYTPLDSRLASNDMVYRPAACGSLTKVATC